MRRLLWSLVLALCGCALRADTSRAGPVLYTFEEPLFTLGQTTPLLDIPPNVGDGTFRTSFTDAVDPTGYRIENVPENALMVGQALYAPFVTSPLTLTFNAPVSQLSVDFAINIPNNGSPAGFLRLVTPSGSIDQTSSNVGGNFQGGTLSFTAATPFTTATLQGFDPSLPEGPQTQIEIDKLNPTPAATAVPEPSTLTLLGIGIAGTSSLAWLRRRSKAG